MSQSNLTDVQRGLRRVLARVNARFGIPNRPVPDVVVNTWDNDAEAHALLIRRFDPFIWAPWTDIGREHIVALDLDPR